MTWFGFLKSGFLVFIAASIVALIVSRFLFKKIIAPVLGMLFSAAIGLLFFLDIFVIEPHWIDVNEVVIKDHKLAAIVGDTRIVQISDIHLTQGLGFREKQLISKINRLKPDILFFTGDLIDDLTQLPHAIKLFKSFKVKYGIYAVPGNTDNIVMDSLTFKRELEPATGIHVLVNESAKIHLENHRILWVVGVDDPVYRHADLDKAVSGVSDDASKILLAHGPSIFEKASTYHNINLVLVGHMHGGQIGIPFLIRLSKYADRTPYVKGLFKKNRTHLYANRGIGMKTLPIRFLCRPEISVFKFVP